MEEFFRDLIYKYFVIAQKYLIEKELRVSNIIVTMYLNNVERQSENHNASRMSDRVEKSNVFLQFEGMMSTF